MVSRMPTTGCPPAVAVHDDAVDAVVSAQLLGPVLIDDLALVAHRLLERLGEQRAAREMVVSAEAVARPSG